MHGTWHDQEIVFCLQLLILMITHALDSTEKTMQNKTPTLRATEKAMRNKMSALDTISRTLSNE